MSSGLGHRIAKSAAWMVGSRMAIRTIGLVSTVILARLLRPEDFGLVALAGALVAATDVFGNFSFDLALIRDTQAAREHYDTVWTLTIIRGLLVGGMLAALAWPAGLFFGDPRVSPIVLCFAGTTLLGAFQNVGIVDFRKELSFHREFIFQVATKLVTFVATVSFAIAWREYWALVFGLIVGQTASVILSYVMHPYRPRIDLSEWRSLIGFSKWMLFSNISNFLSGRLDTFAIGRIINAHAVGLYEIANEIANLPTGELIWPIQRALFPGYAKLTGDRDQLASGYLRGLAIIVMIALPAAVGIACVAQLIMEVFLGPQWVDALPLLQVLAVSGILRVGCANAYTVLLALGRAKLTSHLSFLNLAIFGVLVIGGTLLWGPIGTAFASVVTSAAILAIYVGITLRSLSIPVRTLIASVWRSLGAALAMALVVVAFTAAWPVDASPLIPILELAATVIVGAISYIGAQLILWNLAGCPAGAEKDAVVALTPAIRRGLAALGLRSDPA